MLDLGPICLLRGIPGCFCTIVSWVVVKDAPLHLSQTARRCCDPLQGGWSSAGSEHHTAPGIQTETNAPSTQTELQSFCSQRNASETNCKGLSKSCCVCGYLSLSTLSLPKFSQLSHQAADPWPVFLSSSILTSWDTCSSATHLPLVTEFISLERGMAELIQV